MTSARCSLQSMCSNGSRLTVCMYHALTWVLLAAAAAAWLLLASSLAFKLPFSASSDISRACTASSSAAASSTSSWQQQRSRSSRNQKSCCVGGCLCSSQYRRSGGVCTQQIWTGGDACIQPANKAALPKRCCNIVCYISIHTPFFFAPGALLLPPPALTAAQTAGSALLHTAAAWPPSWTVRSQACLRAQPHVPALSNKPAQHVSQFVVGSCSCTA
jgi:hypothetical protein